MRELVMQDLYKMVSWEQKTTQLPERSRAPSRSQNELPQADPLAYREWFTFCFVPIIPFSLKPYRLIKCHICPFETNVENSDDAVRQMQQIDQGGVPMQPPQQQQPHGGPHQGWNAGNPYGGQPNMSGGAGGGQYQQPQGMPQYK